MGELNVDLTKSLVCIEYPGIVQNVDKMIETLGGLRNMATTYATRNRRLELRFRPNDRFCKPVCGDKLPTMGLLLKIKIKTPKDKNSTIPPEVISTDIIGRVHTIYKFDALCDFQYLTLHKDKNGPLRCCYDEIVPRGMPTASWIGSKAPLFLTPATFSRIDNQQNVSMALDSIPKDVVDELPNVIGRTRRRRSGHAVFLTYKSAPEIAPQAPNQKCLNMLQVKFLDGPQIATIRTLFEERPIWSKNALLYKTGYSVEKLKHLLPAVAYYYVTGPWRAMWVRFGYDPRLDYQSRKYQTLDYRLKATGRLKAVVKAKRSYTNYILPYKTGSSCKPKTVVLGKGEPMSLENLPTTTRQGTINENIYILREGMIPPSRQMFYQYCDLQVPEIMAMLAKLPIPAGSATCDPRRGWMPAGFDERCREIIHILVFDQVRGEKRFEEAGTSADNDNWDDDVVDEDEEIALDADEDYTD